MTLAPADLAQGWLDRLAGEDAQAGLPCNVSSLALVNALTVKSGAGTLFGFSGFNNLAASQFIQVFDARDIPADGAVPVVVLQAVASSNFSAEWGVWGRSFHVGIVIVNSTTAATKTIGAANCWFDAQYV